jgi:predicted nucleic acid-binding protein
VAKAAYLVDNSALARLRRNTAVERRLELLILQGLVAMCSITDLERLFSARSGAEHREWREEATLRFARAEITQLVLDRAIEVQGLLADRAQHRGANVPDLVVAAAAERAGLIVLHYDADFELIAAVTGQPTEWVVPRGSVD